MIRQQLSLTNYKASEITMVSIMKDRAIFSSKISHLSLCVLTALTSQVAFAAEKSAVKEEEVERISVIGSNIKRATDVSTLPVTSLTAEDIENTGAMSGDDLIRSIPQMGAVNFGASTGNGGVNDARGDVGSVNLRGVGSGNTLTLLNGRRLVNHPGTQSENFVPVTTVNTNTLPVSGLRSLEVLRDGAAAIYGSDAVAGVVNYALNTDFEGSRVDLKYGQSQGTSLDELTFNYLTGLEFNGGKTHFTGSFTGYKRNGMMASERAYSASHDLREYPTLPEAFIGDTQLDNRSTSTPWGEFSSPSLKTFHLQPDTMSGCVDSSLSLEGVCVDKGSTGRDIRFDRGTTRSLVSDVNRLNFYGHLTHELSDDLEFFSEAIFYSAKAERTREQTHNLTAQRFKISADAAYNPFGEEISLRKYRPINTGIRNVEVDDTSYRILAGLRGYMGDWEWESAAFYSAAETNDVANRVQASAFQKAINSTDKSTAYNIFAGGDINNPNTTGNIPLVSQDILNQFMVDVHRDSKTSLASIDFQASNSEIFAVPAGDAGLAVGVEFRHEGFEDDRDALLDGSTPFVDAITGVTLSPSDVMGSSPTEDSKASRNVASAFAELIVPIIDSGDQYAEIQFAARYEHFSDVGSALKPKIAAFYQPTEWLSIRASYAGGFRAPGLAQTTATAVRSNTLYDPVLDDSYAVIDIRKPSDDLAPEDDVNTSVGIILEPTENLTLNVDFWKLEQENLVGILSGNSHLLYDSLLRSQGSSNPAVIRDSDTQEVVQINNKYENLDKREISGIDIGLIYDFETSFGDFEFTANAAHLSKFEQVADPVSAQLVSAQEAGNAAVPEDRTISNVGDLIKQNGNPEWQARAAINWKLNEWRLGISAKYTSDLEDTSTTATVDDEVINLPVDSYTTVNAYGSYKFADGNMLEGMKVGVGVRNIFDEEPPLADELAHGYFGSIHSNRGRYLYMSLSKSF